MFAVGWVGTSRIVLACAGLGATPAPAVTLTVVPSQAPYPTLATAVAAARPGDTIELTAAVYRECAVLDQAGLTVRGLGAGATLDGVACAQKAALVADAADITLDNLTIQNITVPALNGAGVRMEGGNLTVTRSRFLNNEEGILTASDAAWTLTVDQSRFTGNGNCIAACAHGIYAGHLRQLRVTNSTFEGQQAGHHIKSRALSTQVIDTHIADGPAGTASFMIDIPNGGDLLVERVTMEKGPKSGSRIAISIGEEGATQPTSALSITGNRLSSAGVFTPIFVDNQTGTPAELVGNQVPITTSVLRGPGSSR